MCVCVFGWAPSKVGFEAGAEFIRGGTLRRLAKVKGSPQLWLALRRATSLVKN